MRSEALIKWSGSKRHIAEQIISYFPKEIKTYYEAFAGGGSVFLRLLETNIKVEKYIISDLNKELIDVYLLIKDNPTLLINTYKKHHLNYNSADIQHRKDYFNSVRDNFNKNKLPEDFFWITRNTINGLVRYNSSGKFNAPPHFGRAGMKPESIEKLILKYNKLFNEKNITFLNQSYENVKPNKGDLLYLDPPYEDKGTKGMYFCSFDNEIFLNYLNNISDDVKWLLNYDGKINNDKIQHNEPVYKRLLYLVSGNSSFRRITKTSNSTIISESLYLNY